MDNPQHCLQSPVHDGGTYDVAVIGGGMAGCAAALAAAWLGLRTVLVEQNAFLGGAATAGMVGQFVGWSTRSGRKVIEGAAQFIVDRLQEAGGAGPLSTFTMSTGHLMNRVEYDAEILKVVLDELMMEAGVDVLLKATLVDAQVESQRVTAATIWAAGGFHRLHASAFVDASGDMGLLSRAGATFLGLQDGEALQPGTMMFSIGPVDFDRLDSLSGAERAQIVSKGLASGALPRAALHYSRAPGSNDAWFNISRVNVEPDDPFSTSRGEIEGRRQAVEISRFLVENLPGCGAARLSSIAPQLGVRDTRRVKGDYVVTRQDLETGRRFADTVACGAYPIDIHKPEGKGIDFFEFPEDHHYCIPFSALIPAGLSNVLAAGRGISATAEAFAALRIMPMAMAMGQAAGIAASMAAQVGLVRDIEISTLQSTLREQNAYLGE